MRIKVYLRLAPTARGHRVVATTKPSSEPIKDQYGDAMPTICFALNLDLPPAAFAIPTIGDIEVPVAALTPAIYAEADVEEGA